MKLIFEISILSGQLRHAYIRFVLIVLIILPKPLNVEDRDQAAPTEQKRPARPRAMLAPPVLPCRKMPEMASPGSLMTAKSPKKGRRRRRAVMKR